MEIVASKLPLSRPERLFLEVIRHLELLRVEKIESEMIQNLLEKWAASPCMKTRKQLDEFVDRFLKDQELL